MIVKLRPASSDRLVWQVSALWGETEIPVDYTHFADEQRSFLGEDGGVFEVEPEAEGWRLVKPRADFS